MAIMRFVESILLQPIIIYPVVVQYFWELVPGSWLLIIFLLLSSERSDIKKLLSAGLYLWHLSFEWQIIGEESYVRKEQAACPGLAHYANWLTFFYWSSLCHSYFDWGERDTIARWIIL